MKKKGIFKIANNIRQVVRNIFDMRSTKSGQAYMSDPPAWLNQFFTGTPVKAGVTVNENSALEYIAFWTCIKVIRETIASLPIVLYKRTEQGKDRAKNHPAYNILHLKANPEQTVYDYKEMTACHYLLYGRTFSEKIYNGYGQLIELWPLMPWCMRVIRIDEKRYYDYTLPDQTKKLFMENEILHISNWSITGLTGEPPIEYAKQAIGTGIAAEEYGARFFSNDATPGGIIEMDGSLKADAKKRFIESWQAGGSLENKHRTRILEQGAKFHEITVPPDKAQFLETRKFQKSLMAAFHRLPPHLIGDLEHATYTNIEHQSLEFVKYSMMPHFVRWEQNFTTQLLTEKEQKKYFFEILVDALTRGDIQTRYRAYRIGREGGWLSPNDVRRKENMNRLPGKIGDIYNQPSNWIELGEKPEPKQIKPDEPNKKPEDDKQTDEEKKDIFSDIHIDIMKRIIKKETKDVQRGLKKYIIEMNDRQAFDEWFCKYRDQLIVYMKDRLIPLYRSMNKLKIGSGETEKDVDQFVNNHIEQNKNILIEAIEKDKDIENFIFTFEGGYNAN